MAFIRRAVPSDAAEIAAVHVASWQETYAHLLPASYIEQRTHAVAGVAEVVRRVGM